MSASQKVLFVAGIPATAMGVLLVGYGLLTLSFSGDGGVVFTVGAMTLLLGAWGLVCGVFALFTSKNPSHAGTLFAMSCILLALAVLLLVLTVAVGAVFASPVSGGCGASILMWVSHRIKCEQERL